MMQVKRIAITAMVALALCGTASADWFLDFEWGFGHDREQISSGIPGLEFTTTGDYDWLYADITTDTYNVQSDNGTSWGSATYFMSGNVFAWLGEYADQGRIDFMNADGSYFTTGYCSYSAFYVEAYDKLDNLLDVVSGPANTVLDGGDGLDYLTVTSASNNIAYVMMHDTGNQWLADNMSGDATGVENPSIPEPATLLLLGAGLLGGGLLRKKI
jgi:hypothetical protein